MQTKHNDDAESYANFLNLKNKAQDDFQQKNMIDFSAHNQVIQGQGFVKRLMKEEEEEQNLDKKYKELKELQNKLPLLKQEEMSASIAFHEDNNKELKQNYYDKRRQCNAVEYKISEIERDIELGLMQRLTRLSIDKLNSLNHAFVSGLLRTVGEPFLYQWFDKNDGNKISKKAGAFGDVDYQELIQNTKLNNDEKSILSIYNFFGNWWNDYDWSTRGKQQLKEASGMILKRKDVLAKLYLKYILFGFTDRHYANVLIDKKEGKTDVLEIDFDPHFEFGFTETDKYFLFDKQGRFGRELGIKHMNEFFNDLQKKSEFKEIVKAIKEQAEQYTMNDTKLKNLIHNVAKFGHHLDIDKDELKKFVIENLEKFKIYSEFRIKNIEENEKYYDKDIKDVLIKSLKETKKTLSELNIEQEIKQVDDYYNLTNSIDNIKNDISLAINQHLGKTDQKNYKKLFWDRKGEGCKDGKLLNERCFLNCKSGYIKKINRKWDRLLDDNNIDYKTKLENLQSFVKDLSEKETNSRCC